MDAFWKKIDKFICSGLYKTLNVEQKDITYLKLEQFIKFGAVGVINNVIYYLVYVVFVSLKCPFVIAGTMGFLASVINAYYWNDRYVFKKSDGEERVWWKGLCKTFVSYIA